MDQSHIQTKNGEFYLAEVSKTDLPVNPKFMENYCGIICHSGESTGMCNLRRFTLRPHSLAIVMPGQIVQSENSTDDFRATVIGMTSAFANSLGIPYSFDANKLIEENPINQFSRQEYDATMNLVEMTANVIINKTQYQLDIIRHLMCAHIYGLSDYLHSVEIQKSYSSEETLVNRFMMELKSNYRTTRSVKQYAEALCVTPGYLSSVLKRITGRTPLELISDYVVLEAKALLRSSDLSIQQICYRLNFPNQSAFGKYFKKIEGVSPVQYRGLK